MEVKSAILAGSLMLGACGRGVSTDSEPLVFSAVASPQPNNLLRYDIQVETTVDATVQIEVWETAVGRDSSWTIGGDATPARKQTVGIWGLYFGAEFSYVIHASSGGTVASSDEATLTVGPQPAGFPTIVATPHTGEPTTPYLLFNGGIGSDVGGLFIADTAGRLRWYELNSVAAPFQAFWYSESDRTIYASAGKAALVGLGLDGRERMRWTFPEVLEAYIHHEVFAYDGRIYSIGGRPFDWQGELQIEDGYQVYDLEGNLLDSWYLHSDGGMNPDTNPPVVESGIDTFWEDEYPGAVDIFHANSLQIVESSGGQKAILSSRHLSQVIQVDMTDRVIDWVLGDNGGPTPESRGDFTWTPDSATTLWPYLQHHAHFEADGDLYLFDNRTSAEDNSRLLRLELDEAARTVRAHEPLNFSEFVETRFEGDCGSGGSVHLLPSGNVLGGCAHYGLFVEFAADGQVVWDLQADCDGEGCVAYRGVPITNLGFE